MTRNIDDDIARAGDLWSVCSLLLSADGSAHAHTVYERDEPSSVSVYNHTGHLVSQYLRGVTFPVSKQDLLRLARSHNAGSDLLHSIEGLAERSYNNAEDVLRALGRSMTH